MREILFRAKTMENNQWVEGFYVHVPCGRFLSDEHLIQTIKDDGRIGQLHTVYERTVEQFTGLNDKNGKKIFEGDILKTIIGNGVVNYGTGCFCVHYRGSNNPAIDIVMHDADVEIIGNIHDNPELLEVSDGK